MLRLPCKTRADAVSRPEHGAGVDVPSSFPVVSCVSLTSCTHFSSPPPFWGFRGVAPEPILPDLEVGPTFSLGLPFDPFLGQPDGTVAGICQPCSCFSRSTTALYPDPGPPVTGPRCASARLDLARKGSITKLTVYLLNQERKYTGRLVIQGPRFNVKTQILE